MGIDVPHSHEEEVRIDRLARERREGGLLIQRNEPISNRPSTTLTSSLEPSSSALTDELIAIEGDFYTMVANMNQMSSGGTYIPISGDDI